MIRKRKTKKDGYFAKIESKEKDNKRKKNRINNKKEGNKQMKSPYAGSE